MDKKQISKILIISGVVLIFLLVAKTIPNSKKLNNQSDFIQSGVPAQMKSESMPSESEMVDSNMMIRENVVGMDSSQVVVDKKIIKNGNLNLQVDRVDVAVGEINQIAKENGGDIFSSNFSQTERKIKNGNISIKVPVANFEKTFEDLKRVASLVVAESVFGQDVTEEYVDLQSRLKNKRAEEDAFAKILERSGEIDDVLKVTRELSRVRGEIELLQGQIKYLESQTDMSLIQVYLSEDEEIAVVSKWRPWQLAKETINLLISDFQKFVDFIIVLIIRVIPILIAYFLLIFVAYLVGKKIYSKFRNQ